jgi:hypothetical protein
MRMSTESEPTNKKRKLTDFYKKKSDEKVLIKLVNDHYYLCVQSDLEKTHLILYYMKRDTYDGFERGYVTCRYLVSKYVAEKWTDPKDIEVAQRIFPQMIGHDLKFENCRNDVPEEMFKGHPHNNKK